MIIYQGIQVVYSHISYLIRQVALWFQNIDWSVLLNELPINYIPFVSAIVTILLAMSAVGLVKKLSFLLG